MRYANKLALTLNTSIKRRHSINLTKVITKLLTSGKSGTGELRNKEATQKPNLITNIKLRFSHCYKLVTTNNTLE